MARVRVAPARRDDGGAGDRRPATGRGQAARPPAAGVPGAPVDPRAVRVGLAAGAGTADERPIVVGPPVVPLTPSGGRLAGTGLLGGIAPEAPPAGDRHGPASTRVTPDPGSGASSATVVVDGEAIEAWLIGRGRARATLVVGSGPAATRYRIILTEPPAPDADGIVRREIVVDGWRVMVEVEPERRAALRERARRGRETTAHGGPTEVRAIIPGRVVSVSVVPGDAITAGQQILVVEAMKMQNELRAPRDGTVRSVGVAPGTTIEVGDLLLVIG